MKKKIIAFFSPLLLPLLITGCGTATIQRFDSFAQSGSQYTQAVGKLVDDTSDLLVDANSTRLLASRQLAPVKAEDFKQQDDTMKQQVRDLRVLKRQAELLGQYFGALAKLAEKDDSEQIAGELNDIGSALNDVAKAMGKSDRKLLGQIAGEAGKVVVKGVQAGRLREELEKRGEVIARVLQQQGDLLQDLGQEAEDAQGYLDQRGYQEAVVQPFLASDPIPQADWQSWIDGRRSALRKAPVPDSLHQAFTAAVSLRAAWVGLLENELDPEQLEQVSSQATAIATGAAPAPATAASAPASTTHPVQKGEGK